MKMKHSNNAGLKTILKCRTVFQQFSASLDSVLFNLSSSPFVSRYF